MPDTLAAIAILPFLILFTLALECTRIGCVWVYRTSRPQRPQTPASPATTRRTDVTAEP